MINHNSNLDPISDASIKEVISNVISWFNYLRSKFVIILALGFFGGVVGYIYAYSQKPKYVAKLTFALEEEKSNGALSGAMGLASSLGIDLGSSAGGAFSGANIIELMKSRTIIEKALLNPIEVNKQIKSLADFYIEINNINKKWAENPKLRVIKFLPNADRANFNFYQDSILGRIYESISSPKGLLSVAQKDKKISIVTIEVTSVNELFAKSFTESIAKEVSNFYVDTKVKKSKANVAILQKQADSIRFELNSAITGVAVANDNTFNLNSAIFVPKSTALKRQVDVQANTAILTQLVTNLEMAKVALRKETPLIQIIDSPILPLKMEKASKLKFMMIFGFLFGMTGITYLIFKKWWRSLGIQ